MLAGWHYAQKVHLAKFILAKCHGYNIFTNVLHNQIYVATHDGQLCGHDGQLSHAQGYLTQERANFCTKFGNLEIFVVS